MILGYYVIFLAWPTGAALGDGKVCYVFDLLCLVCILLRFGTKFCFVIWKLLLFNSSG